MSQLDPWRGTNQGLATLRGTFDELENRRMRQEEMDRRDRRDELNEPFLQTRNELSGMELEEKQRAVASLQEYDAERKAQEEGFSTDAAQPAQGLPATEGKAPMNDDSKTNARLMLAMKHGRLDEAMKLGQFMDITDKIDARQITKIQNVMKAINSIRQTMGPQVALAQGKKLAIEMGVDPAAAAQMVISPQGIVTVPDGKGGSIVNFTDVDGKVHVYYNKPEKSDALDREKLAETKRHNRAVEAKKETGSTDKSDDKEEKRKVKALTDARREIERGYGFSQFLPSAQDPKLIEKVGRAKETVEDIINNYKQHGLTSEPTPGKAAMMAKKLVDDQYKKPVATAPAEDKKSKSIRELLFGS